MKLLPIGKPFKPDNEATIPHNIPWHFNMNWATHVNVLAQVAWNIREFPGDAFEAIESIERKLRVVSEAD